MVWNQGVGQFWIEFGNDLNCSRIDTGLGYIFWGLEALTLEFCFFEWHGYKIPRSEHYL